MHLSVFNTEVYQQRDLLDSVADFFDSITYLTSYITNVLQNVLVVLVNLVQKNRFFLEGKTQFF